MKTPALLLLVAAAGLANGQATSPAQLQPYAGLLEKARAAESAGDYETAATHYQSILERNPGLAMIQQSLALTFHLRNRYSEAIAGFQTALKLDPSLWGSQLFLGMDLYKVNQFAPALPPLRKSIELNASMAEPEARFWLGVTLRALARPEESVRELRRALELRPGDSEVLYQTALSCDAAAASVFQRLGEMESGAAILSLLQAERFLDEDRERLAAIEYGAALQLRPDYEGALHLAPARSQAEGRAITAYDARALRELASLHAALGDAVTSQALLKHLQTVPAAGGAAQRPAGAATQMAPLPESVRAPALEALSLKRQGRAAQAAALMAKTRVPGAGHWWEVYRAQAESDSGDLIAAETRLRAILAKSPRQMDALALLGRNYKKLAARVLQAMIDRDPESYGVHQLLGQRHEARTEYADALREYQAALARRSDLDGIRYAIGNVHAILKQNDDAERWLRQELERNPFHGLANYRLGVIRLEQGRFADAATHLSAAWKSRPDIASIQLELGRAYFGKEQYGEAIRAFRAYAEADPENDRVHFLLANALAKSGRTAEAATERALFQELTRKRLERAQRAVQDVSEAGSAKP